MSALPTTMRAVQLAANGGPEVIQLNEVPVPAVTDGTILIKMEWAGVNYIDNYIREGLYPNRGGWPMSFGQEGAGTIVALPPNPPDHKEYARRGYKIGQKVAFFATGAYAEYAAIPWGLAVPLPDHVSTRDAAALLLQGLTVVTMTEESYLAKKDDWILVHAAAGGLGLIFCQVLKDRGCHVIGTTSTPEKAALAREHGAEHVILYSGPNKEDTVARVAELTGGKGVQGIYDGVGKDTWEDDFKMIATKGTIVFAGNASGVVPPFPVLKMSEKNTKITRPTLVNNTRDPEETGMWADQLWDLVSRGVIKSVVFKEYPLTAEGLRQTCVDQKGRASVGKLLVKIGEEA